MLQFPMPNGDLLCVIEPANLKRLKEGSPLLIGQHCVVFTPDMRAFMKALGLEEMKEPKPSERINHAVHIKTDQLLAAIDMCHNLPEVDRG